MRKLLLITTALVVFPSAADADPLIAGVIGLFGTTGSWFASLGWFGQFLVQLGASLALSAVANALSGNSRNAGDESRDLQRPQSRPPKRTVYGHARVHGSWAPLEAKTPYIYGGLIFNSRPSEGPFTLYLDRREVVATGNPYDLSGPGAVATNEPFAGYVRFWIGRGDQTDNPRNMEWVPAYDIFDESDAWRGSTVLWVKIDRGPSESRGDRWPNPTPEIQMEANWSRVWDPREPTQNPANPATWAYSANQALCLLDALRTNPIGQYALDQIHLPSFIHAADVADETIATLDGDEPRYEANGWVVWRPDDLLGQTLPLQQAGGGLLAMFGGQVGYIPAAWRAPVGTVSNFLAEGAAEFSSARPLSERAHGYRGEYVAPARDWQPAQLPIARVPGAPAPQGEDDKIEALDLRLVTSPTQAMRLQQIAARKMGQGKSLTLTLGPDGLRYLPGAVVTLDLSGAFERWNGTYEVENPAPGAWLQGDQGAAMRVPVTLRQTAESVFAWVPATDQLDLVEAAFDPSVAPLPVPTDLEGAFVAEGLRLSWAPPAITGLIERYEWEFRIEASGDPWVRGLFVPDEIELQDGLGRYFVIVAGADTAETWEFRARSASASRVSAWVLLGGIEV